MVKKLIIINQDSEADTCRKEVTPKLYDANWSDEQILEQRTFTDGKIVVLGRKARRKKGKRADYILRYKTNYPIAVIEAKKKYSKTKPIQNEEFGEISQWWNNRKETEWAWKVNINDIVKENGNGSVSVNLDIKNPNRKSEFEYQESSVLISSIVEREKKILKLIEEIQSGI